MSKFDVTLTRKLIAEARAPHHRDDPVGSSPVLCALGMALDYIAVLERVREAANLYLRTGRGDLEDALAACDDGEGK